MSAPAVDVDVLVVGSGPMGTATALALARYGIGVHVVTKRTWLADGPRAHVTNQRTMEVLRDLGVEDAATAVATPWHLMGDMAFMTSVAGPELARMRAYGTGDDRRSDYLTGSPCPQVDIPQNRLEPVLVDAAASAGAVYRTATEYLSHEQDDAGVSTRVRDRLTGEERTIRSRYLVGADGARSQVLTDAGLSVEGRMGRATSVYTVFAADLTRYVAHRPSVIHWIMNPAVGFGEIGMGTLRAIRPWTEWIAGWGHDLDAGPPDTSPEAVLPSIRAMIGDPDVEVRIRSTSTWQVNQAWSPRYSSGRVLCGGDAVHRHPPSGGLGSNTSIQDGFNLAWKLAYVLRGWAGPDLLESYTAERAPVGQQVVQRANQARLDYGPIRELFAARDVEDPAAEMVRRLRDAGDDGVLLRERLAEALALKDTEHNAQGTEMNQRYRSGAVLPDPDPDEEVFERDRLLHLQATTRPGAKIPHVWLTDRFGRRISSLDVVGGGATTVVTGPAGWRWARAVEELGLPYLRAVVIGGDDVHDAYLAWHRVRATEEAGCLLVRPDGYVAWRRVDGVADVASAVEVLRDVLEEVLAQPRR